MASTAVSNRDGLEAAISEVATLPHHSRPAAVLVDWEAFEFLVKHVQDLEELAEEIFQDPAGQGAALRRSPLAGWRKYKFHSTSRPAPYARPDMRIIYRVQGQEVQELFPCKDVG